MSDSSDEVQSRSASSSDDKRRANAVMRVLIAVAKADGVIDDREKAVLRSFASKLGIARDEFRALASEKAVINIGELPTAHSERLKFLTDVFVLAVADGTVAPAERAIADRLAEGLGIGKEDVKACLRAARELTLAPESTAVVRRPAQRPPNSAVQHVKQQSSSREQAAELFESIRPSGDGRCSDPECPCADLRIPRGEGFLYISQELVEFRRDCLSEKQLDEKCSRMAASSESRLFFLAGTTAPILMCEQGARRRGLELHVAAEDAQYWWHTGMAPLRPTPQTATMQTMATKSAGPLDNVGAISGMTPPQEHLRSTALTPATVLDAKPPSSARCPCGTSAPPNVLLCPSCANPVGWSPIAFSDRKCFSDFHCSKCGKGSLPSELVFLLEVVGIAPTCPNCCPPVPESALGNRWDVSNTDAIEALASEDAVLAYCKRAAERTSIASNKNSSPGATQIPAEFQLAGRCLLRWLELHPSPSDAIINALCLHWMGGFPMTAFLKLETPPRFAAENWFCAQMHYATRYSHQVALRADAVNLRYDLLIMLILKLIASHPPFATENLNAPSKECRLFLHALRQAAYHHMIANRSDLAASAMWNAFHDAYVRSHGTTLAAPRGTARAPGEKACFVATAAYAEDAPEVAILRRFRDDVLLRSTIGRASAQLYYELSPPLATFIRHRRWIRKFVRGVLWPTVYLARCATRLSRSPEPRRGD